MRKVHFFISTDYFWQFEYVNLRCDRKKECLTSIILNTMGLLDFLFGSREHINGSSNSRRKTGHNYTHSSGNWADADDWQCGNHDGHDGMYGFDKYEENDF